MTVIKISFESNLMDLMREGIRTSVLCPRIVRTPLTDRHGVPMPFSIEAGEAAGGVVDGIKAGKLDMYFPRLFSLLRKAVSLLPGSLFMHLCARMVTQA